jgi:enoyl-CoA hydratase/carnithine racemase
VSIIDLERRGDVVVARWADGENRYRLDSLARWDELLTELEATEGPLALVVTGEGKFFSNGLDLDWMGEHPDDAGAVVEQVHRLFGRMLLLPAYTVAAINGHAFAGGAMLACAFDVRVMRTDRGYWCLPEVDLGIPLTEPMMEIVTVRLPRAAAHDAIMTGRRYAATEAQSLGIVEHVADEADVLDRAVELAAVMAPKDRGVIAAHKRMLFGRSAAICGWPQA